MSSQLSHLSFITSEEHVARKERKLKSIKCDKQTSSLTAREQKKYLYLLQKYSNKVISAPSETERKVIETLAALHAKVVAEQRKFAEFQKTGAKSGIEYSFIHPEASRYVKELIQKKLQSCLCYSRHYIAREKLSLSEDVSVDSSALPYLVCNLLELGRVPKLISPNLDKCTIQHNYRKMCRRFPITFPSEISSEYSSKKPISQDSIAKTLADKHSADVIISFSSLKHLLTCRSLNCDTSWELPVTVASFPSIEATSCCVKRIFIDKAIPAGIWLPHRINLLYHKYGAKLQFTHFKPSKDRRNTQPFCCGTGENRHNREIRKLQDACFESENFLHETFGQISCSPEKKALVTEASRKKDIKTSDSIHNVKDEDKSVQVANDNQTSPVSNGESLSIIGLNKITKIEFDKDKSDQNCNYFDKENELLLKDVSVATKGIGDILSEEKCFSKILCTTESCHSNTENILKSQNTVNAKCSPDSVLHNYLEQTKESNTDVEERKSSDESAFEESPECKKRKRITKTPVINTGRRVTRSQTKKLEEDTVKHSLLSKKLEFECKTEKANKILKTKQSEITEQSSVQENKNNNQHSEKEAMKIKDLKAVEQEEIQSEFSNDSFPRSVLRRPKLLSSDEDSDDNLVIDEDSSGVDDKQTDLTEFSNCNELNSSGNVTISALNNEEPSHGNISQLQTERTYIHDISKKINITQSENFQSVSIDNPANENSKLSSGEKKDSGSTLDHILHLQEEMLKPKNKVLHAIIEQTPQVSSGPQPGLPTYLEDASQFSPLDPSLNANAQYSLWNMGQLKVIMRSKLDSRQPNSVPCFIFSKLEYQSQFGGEVCSEHELLCQWFTLLCHPGSVGLRVRIDARTSKVLMIENLTLPDMHNLVAKLSPEKPLCWILNVFEKLKGLPDGQYLLAHQKKEDVITVYAATDGSKRGDFDLHTAIRQRLVALDDDNSGWNSVDSKTEVPWLPIDPDVMLPSLVCNNRIPATFPPAKGRETLPKRKRKRSKKKSKATKIKAKFQKM